MFQLVSELQEQTKRSVGLRKFARRNPEGASEWENQFLKTDHLAEIRKKNQQSIDRNLLEEQSGETKLKILQMFQTDQKKHSLQSPAQNTQLKNIQSHTSRTGKNQTFADRRFGHEPKELTKDPATLQSLRDHFQKGSLQASFNSPTQTKRPKTFGKSIKIITSFQEALGIKDLLEPKQSIISKNNQNLTEKAEVQMLEIKQMTSSDGKQQME